MNLRTAWFTKQALYQLKLYSETLSEKSRQTTTTKMYVFPWRPQRA